MAIQAALTGHLVFSTLHTNDAPSAITRLIDMGVKPFLVASCIQAVMAQRLIRVICHDCKEPLTRTPTQGPAAAWVYARRSLPVQPSISGKGCNTCNGTGYRGRQGIFEMMVMNHAIAGTGLQPGPAERDCAGPPRPAG